MSNNEEKTYDEDVTPMSVSVKPIKLAFTVRADKFEEFKSLDGSKKITEIKKTAKKIKNIKIGRSVYGKR